MTEFKIQTSGRSVGHEFVSRAQLGRLTGPPTRKACIGSKRFPPVSTPSKCWQRPSQRTVRCAVLSTLGTTSPCLMPTSAFRLKVCEAYRSSRMISSWHLPVRRAGYLVRLPSLELGSALSWSRRHVGIGRHISELPELGAPLPFKKASESMRFERSGLGHTSYSSVCCPRLALLSGGNARNQRTRNV